jgi:hypothetical protein
MTHDKLITNQSAVAGIARLLGDARSVCDGGTRR